MFKNIGRSDLQLFIYKNLLFYSFFLYSLRQKYTEKVMDSDTTDNIFTIKNNILEFKNGSTSGHLNRTYYDIIIVGTNFY